MHYERLQKAKGLTDPLKFYSLHLTSHSPFIPHQAAAAAGGPFYLCHEAEAYLGHEANHAPSLQIIILNNNTLKQSFHIIPKSLAHSLDFGKVH